MLSGPLAALLVAFQVMTPYPRVRPTQKTTAAKGTYDEDLTATFHGTVRTNQGKTLRIEDDDNKILEFHCTHKTGYFDGDKKIKASDLKPGVRVSVDSIQFPDGELNPVNIHVVHETTKKPAE